MTREAEEMRMMGERMRAIRERRGYTIEEVARKLGMGRVNYNRKELGGVIVNAPELAELAKLMGVPVGYFYGEIDDEEVEQDEFIQFYNGRPPDQQEQARRVLKALFATQDEIGRQLSREDTTHGKKAE